jgi:hypothetical protein
MTNADSEPTEKQPDVYERAKQRLSKDAYTDEVIELVGKLARRALKAGRSLDVEC